MGVQQTSSEKRVKEIVNNSASLDRPNKEETRKRGEEKRHRIEPKLLRVVDMEIVDRS